MHISTRIRRFIKRRPSNYLLRWQKACDKCWGIFASVTPTPEVLARMQRTHVRLMRLADKRKPFGQD